MSRSHFDHNTLTMEIHRKINVLSSFHPYLHMLQAYNHEKFRDNSKSLILRHIGYTFLITIFIISIPIAILLSIWYLIENDFGISEFSASFASIIIYVQMLFLCVAMVVKNKAISKELRKIQKIIDERKWLNHKLHWKWRQFLRSLAISTRLLDLWQHLE